MPGRANGDVSEVQCFRNDPQKATVEKTFIAEACISHVGGASLRSCESGGPQSGLIKAGLLQPGDKRLCDC